MTKYIDFNTLATGTVVDNEYKQDGVTISAIGGSNKAMIFDTAHPTGGDTDLATDNLGKVLIISEDGDSHDPDDNAHGGTLRFVFDTPSKVESLTFLDVEESAWVKFFDAHGNHIKTIDVHGGVNNGQQVVDFNVAGVARMDVILGGSGAIDNLKFSEPAIGDGIVSNDNEAALIDTAYTGDPEGDKIDNNDALLPGEVGDDDIVDANGGDDTILAGNGNDDVYAGSGDDVVDGGKGNDLIFGDSNLDNGATTETVRESFEWDLAGVGDNKDLAGFTQNTGNVEVEFSILKETGHAQTQFESDQQKVHSIVDDGNGVDANSSLYSVLNGQGNQADYALDFSEEVENVSFRINDVDGDGIVRVKAFDAHGNQITVNLSAGKNVTLKDTDGVAGNDTADSKGGYDADTSGAYSVLVSIPGPVSRIVLEHDQDGHNNTGINVTDVFFDATVGVVDDGADGNDSLVGGHGEDTIFGEGGDDTLEGGKDNDSLVGGDGNDRIDGGAGADTIDAGADRDVILGGAGDDVDGGSEGDDFDILDLTGKGPFFLAGPDGTGLPVEDSNGNGIDGTVIFVDGDGNPTGETISFTEIERVVGDQVNRGPEAQDDEATMQEDGAPITIDVLANDSDPDGDPLEIVSATVPAEQGTVEIVDGKLVFTPAENFNGDATITYTITDGTETASADVTVDVTPVNDAPDAMDDSDTTQEDTAIVVDLLANDTDVDGDTLMVTFVSVPANQGTVVNNGDGTATFTPADNFTGTAMISYDIKDGNGGRDWAKHFVEVQPVNDGPIAGDDAFSEDEDGPAGDVEGNVLNNDTDADGDTLRVISVTNGTDTATVADAFGAPGQPMTVAGTTGGLITINNGGNILFDPNGDFEELAVGETTTTTVSYTVSDGKGGTDTATVTITVTGKNDAPDAVDDTDMTDEDTVITVDLLANDTDIDGDTLTVTNVKVPAEQGTVVDNGDGTATFTPAPGFNGTAMISYDITDGNGGRDWAKHFVEVKPVNDGPVANDDTATTAEDTAVTIDVLGNDTDEDGDTLTIVEATVPADQGTVEIVGGQLVFTPALDFNGPAQISYTITDGTTTDTAVVDVDVTPVNDAPVATDDTAETDENDPVIINVLGNDVDPDGDTLTVTEATSDDGEVVINGDGTLTFTPNPGFTGDASITYTVSDGELTDTATVDVTVNENEDPFDEKCTFELLNHTSNGFTYGMRLDDLNEPGRLTFDFQADDAAMFLTTEGDTIRIFGTMQGSDGDLYRVDFLYNGASQVAGDDDIEVDDNLQMMNTGLLERLDTDGNVVETYDLSDKAGDNQFTFRLGDEDNDQGHRGADNDSGWGWLSVDGNRDSTQDWIFELGDKVEEPEAPIAKDDAATTDEDVAVVIDVLDNDMDPMGQDLTVVEATSPNGQVTINPDGTLTFTPDADFNGPTTISYTVEDPDGNSDTATVTVDVTPVNDEPIANDDTATTDENTEVTVDVVSNDTDVDGDTLTITEADVPADQGSVEIVDNKLVFTPAPGFSGEATITYTIEDGNGGSDTADAVVTVNNVNDAPDAVDDVVEDTVVEGGASIMIDALDNDTDPDNDPLTITEANVTGGAGTVAIVGNMIEYTPAADLEGPVEITYTIEDPDGLSDTAIITLTVQDGIVTGTDLGELIDPDYTGDPGGDLVDSGDNIFSDDPLDADDDIIVAGGGDDTVVAGPGDDVVSGGTGNDQLHGGPGDDDLSGDEGADTINGGAGDDTIDGGDDDDVINGGDGSDSILGGGGNDSIISSDPDNNLKIDKEYPGLFTGEEGTPEAENERDFVDGGAGNDTISTGDDRDTIIGGTGDDVIDGGIDDDTITGDEGNDRIVGGEGEDTIEGGEGNDTIFAGNDPVLGLDQLNIEDDGSNPFFGPDLRPDNGRDLVFGGDGDDVIFGADDDDVLFGEEGNDFIDGEIDDDTIDGGIGNDTLLGGQGRDSIIGGEGDDSIDGGLNRDTIEGGDGADTINGGNGKDELFGGAGNDVIDGGTGEDMIDGGAGEDDITGSTGNDTITGGSGNDTIDGNGGIDDLSGGDDRDLFINVNAGDVVDGNEGGDDFDVLDLTGSAEPGGSLTINKDPLNEENGTVTYRDADGNITGTLTFTNIEDFIPCFTTGTLIATPTGERRVEDLEVGDRVITRDNGIQQIRWTGHRGLDAAKLEAAPHLHPVLIRKGALGGGLPERDMMVSPQHRVLIASEKAALFFEEREVLVAAKHLVGMDGIDVVEASEITYIHVMFDQHEVILSDGAWTESFQPGDQSMGSMDEETRAELFELFPELQTAEGINAYAAARRSLKKHEAALLTD
ncbi:MAG: Ig-like domain-containing protein [Pseudomonadota bacterium]